MGTSSRDLRVRFIGDAAALQGTFNEVSAGAAAAGAGLHTSGASAENVGKSFTKTGKVFKATGKILHSSGLDAASAGTAFASTIPALSGMAGGAGMLVTQLDSLSTVVGSLGPVALPVLGAAAIAAGVAFVIFRDRVSSATEALNLQREANQKLAEQHRATGQAVTAHEDAVTSLRASHLSLREATLSLQDANVKLVEVQREGGKGSIEYRQALLTQERATQKVADAEKAHGRSSLEYRSALSSQAEATRKVTEAENAGGKGSVEYRRALLDQARAQEAVRTARQDVIRQSVDALRTTKASAKAIDDEVVATRAAADEARKRRTLLQLSAITGKDAAAANREISRTLNAESKAASQSAAKHRDNAQRAREMADAIGTATPRAQALHDKLLALSRTEVNTAAIVSNINAITSAADAASAGVAHVVGWLQTLNSTPGPSATGDGGKPKRPSKKGNDEWTGGQTEDGWPSPASRRPAAAAASMFRPLRGDLRGTTISDRTDAAIAARHRDDSLQDKRVGAAAAAKAKKRGVTNPDKLQEISDLAVLKVRKAEVIKDIAAVRKGLKKVVGAIGKARTKLAKQRASRRKAKKDDQSKLDSAISTTVSQIQGLWDQHRALLREGNELVAEARELGYDIKQLDTELKTLPDAAPGDTDTGGTGDTGGDSGPTEADAIDAAIAEAALTPDTADDKAAADAAIDYWRRELDAARASGDPRRVSVAAQGLKQAQDNRAALDANTDAVNGLKDSVDGLSRSFGGSTVFSYRGQDNPLRWMSPPSSDRLVGAETLL